MGFWIAFLGVICGLILLFYPIAQERLLPRWLLWIFFWINAIVVLRSPEPYRFIRFMWQSIGG